jgi:hypothetical protein
MPRLVLMFSARPDGLGLQYGHASVGSVIINRLDELKHVDFVEKKST